MQDPDYTLIARKVMNKLTNRSGFDNLWDDCDSFIQDEILTDIAEIIEQNIDPAK